MNRTQIGGQTQRFSLAVVIEPRRQNHIDVILHAYPVLVGACAYDNSLTGPVLGTQEGRPPIATPERQRLSRNQLGADRLVEGNRLGHNRFDLWHEELVPIDKPSQRRSPKDISVEVYLARIIDLR